MAGQLARGGVGEVTVVMVPPGAGGAALSRGASALGEDEGQARGGQRPRGGHDLQVQVRCDTVLR